MATGFSIPARPDELEDERAGIASYVRRHEGNQGSHIPWSATEPESDWSSLPRSEAVARVLAEASVPNSPAEIADALRAVGRNDDYRDVAAALSHLKSRGRAKNVSRGSWVLVTEAPDDADHEPSDRHDDGYWDAIASEIDQEEEPPL